MSETVLVTGGTGFLALEIIHQLLAGGKYKVRASVRNLDNYERNKPLLELAPNAAQGQLELVQADLLSSSCWVEATAGVHYVLHTASPFILNDRNEDKIVKPAVEGTLNVLRACSREGSLVKRVVVTSSTVAVTEGRHAELPDTHVYTEDDWTNPDTAGNPYDKSKTLAERAAWDFVRKCPGPHRFELNVVNPSLILGRYRGNPGTSVDLVTQLMSGRIPLLPDVRFGVVDVFDAGRVHLAAMTSPVSGQRFITVAEVIHINFLAQVLASELKPKGFKVTTRRMPYWILWMLCFVRPELRVAKQQWGRQLHVDGRRVEKMFDFTYKDVVTTIKDTGRLLAEDGIVKPRKKW